MTSRLDRLFSLLETGTNAVTRKVAAERLGDVVKAHPHELEPLLNRIFSLLCDSSWDTRIAASQAICAIVKTVPQWNPSALKINEKDGPVVKMDGLSLDTFDLNAILTKGAPLIASDITQFSPEHLPISQEEARKQYENINKQFSFNGDSLNIVAFEDVAQCSMDHPTDLDEKKSLNEILKLDASFLNSYENHGTKRKIKQKMSSDQDTLTEMDDASSTRKKLKLFDNVEIPPENFSWPFEDFTTKLKQNLFHSNWEIRHGVATALREIIKIHGKGAGRVSRAELQETEVDHQKWLEDLSLRLVCVLALDRFGDFLSDQVVAPVRETCAQCLGSTLVLMDDGRVIRIVSLLTCLLQASQWEVRHGALLALKYLLAVREDLVDTVLPTIFPLVLERFSDNVDDVCAEAAAALIPVCNRVVSLVPNHVVLLLTQLSKSLAEQDDLNSACNSFMELLASIIVSPEIRDLIGSIEITNVLPRLFSLMFHNAISVRKSAMQTVHTITGLISDNYEWNFDLLCETLKNIYQRVILEPCPDVRNLAEQAWTNLVNQSDYEKLARVSCKYFCTWMCWAMQPTKLCFDASSSLCIRASTMDTLGPCGESDSKYYIGGSEMVAVNVREENAFAIRLSAARMMGTFTHRVTTKVVDDMTLSLHEDASEYGKIFLVYLNSKTALSMTVCALTIIEWLRRAGPASCPQPLGEKMRACLHECGYFNEIAAPFTQLMHDAKNYAYTMKQHKVPIHEKFNLKILTLDEITELLADETYKSVKLKKYIVDDILKMRENLKGVTAIITSEQQALTIMTESVIACAVLELGHLPEKLTPIIKPLVASIKKENCQHLQEFSVAYLAKLVKNCVGRLPCPNQRIISNLCSMLCSDPEFTPKIPEEQVLNEKNPTIKYDGIITFANQQRVAEKLLAKKCNKVGSKRTFSTETISEEPWDENGDDGKGLLKIQRRGATMALQKIVGQQGNSLPTDLPHLWDLMFATIAKSFSFLPDYDMNELKGNDKAAENLTHSLQILEILSPCFHQDLLKKIFELCPIMGQLLAHPYAAVRHLSARCLSVLATVDSAAVMTNVIRSLLPFLEAADCVIKRQGAVEAVSCIADSLKLDIVPYIVVLIIPLLGRMSDQDVHVRMMTADCFGNLIQLMPLDAVSTPFPNGVPPELADVVDKQRSFLNQLLNPGSIPNYRLSVAIKTQLRSYQQSGVNWLAFLNKYNLHGILCDDMGLGKTLQSLCILADDHNNRKNDPKQTFLPSLVICPPTLVGHWTYEMDKFMPEGVLKALAYEGVPMEREKLRPKLQKFNVVVASYDIVRKDADFFSGITWNYCILDEGHVIRNGKTKASVAVKRLTANHRLILSGTPIQNNVLELWSLFDFLMPGFLGTHKQFSAKYSRPVFACRDGKCSQKEREAGTVALESLHAKVLPFILRRMKEQVLEDLPPKITQDYYCELSWLQQMLYEDFAKGGKTASLKAGRVEDEGAVASCSETASPFSIFQALRYLQSVCNHPKLVLTPQHPQYNKVVEKLLKDNSSLADIKHATKLQALKQLLLDCGIGLCGELEGIEPSVVSQHRALIFCQLRAMLDIVENDLFKSHMPNVSYLRLDGKVPPIQRHSIVTTFNNDPSIDVLLLTTQVGGLGLNLTGADTVIFVEHDWSPMKDLQAMDRAHRIGQKKVVNVYRLVTRSTLEEKIMSLQKFKLMTANTVISAENSSLASMSTEKLLDLFDFKSDSSANGEENEKCEEKDGKSVSDVLKSLPELWDAKDYEEEYDLSAFVNSFKREDSSVSLEIT